MEYVLYLLAVPVPPVVGDEERGAHSSGNRRFLQCSTEREHASRPPSLTLRLDPQRQ